MGDAGEGLIDAEARIQERMEELASERQKKPNREIRDREPDVQRTHQALTLARTELQQQLIGTAHPGRKGQLTQALEEIDRRLAEVNSRP